jgi:tetratricopeptide (TPR) repeat protein
MRLDAYSPEPYLKIFSIHLDNRKYDEAEDALKEALNKGVSDASIYASLGYLFVLQKKYTEAIKNYTIAIEKAPKNDLYKFYLAAALDRLGKKDEAIKMLEDIVSASPDFPEVYNYLGYLYAEEGKKLDRAITLIQKALARDPENGAYIDSLGWAYYKKGMFDEALQQLRKAAEHLPDDAIVRAHLGDAYFAKGMLTEAADEWKKSLKMDPDNQDVKDKLSRAAKEMRKR